MNWKTPTIAILLALTPSGCAARKPAPIAAPPAGAKLVVFEGFESGGFNPFWDAFNTFYTKEMYAPATSQQPFVTGPVHSGRYAAHLYAMKGTDEKRALYVGKYPMPECSEFYIQWYEYIEPGFPWPKNSHKIMRFTDSIDGAERRGFQINLENQRRNSNLQLSSYNYADGSEHVINTGASVPEGRWYKFTVAAKLNTPGQSNGFMRIWLDDKLIGSREGLDIRHGNLVNFNEMWIGGNYSNTTPLETDGHRYLDDISWYDRAE